MSNVIPVNLSNPRVSSLAGNSAWTALALTDWDAGCWSFLKDVAGKVYGTVRVPEDYGSNGQLILSCAWNATTGDAVLNVGTSPIADGESFDPGALTDETPQTITVPGTAYLRDDVTFTLTPTLVAGDILIVEVFHDGADGSDTVAADTLLFGAFLSYDV